MERKQKNNSIVQSVNPIAMSIGGLSGGCGELMPPAIHSPVSEETVKNESSIDYPVSEGLCPEIWDEVEPGKFMFNPDIKIKALELVDKLLAKYRVEAKGVNVVGSICSNQYTDDADIDIHIQVDIPPQTADALNKLRKLEQDSLFAGENLLVGGTHPLEFYFQSNLYADMGSCGCYDLMNDEWLSGPQLVDLEFDPYSEYEQSWDEAFQFGLRVQTALFELHKNLYKYNAILEQSSNRDVYSNEQMMSLIQRRLEEVKDEIEDNMGVVSELKDEMVQVRRRSGVNPENEQQAEEMRTNREWLTANSTFKFLQRLDVIDSCWYVGQLYKYMKSGQIDISTAIQDMDDV